MISHVRSGESLSAAEMLCSNLAQGIHAVAQPLAVLVASLSKDYTDRMNCDQLRALTATSAAEVKRLCTLFSSLQQLVLTESTTPQLSPTPILPLLAYAADGVNLVFQQDGISLCSVLPDACPPVLIHRARTLQALSRVLLIVHGLSRARDAVELIASASADAVEVVIQNLNLSPATMSAEARLSMADRKSVV